MLCARVMRGTSSMATSVAPRSATVTGGFAGRERLREPDED